MKHFLFALIFVPSLALAAPVKIPALSLCLQKSGNLVVKQKCAKGETKLTGGGISALGSQGPAGPVGPSGAQGPAGAAGSSAINGCRNVSINALSEPNGTLILDLACNCNEYMLNYHWSSDTYGVFPFQAAKLVCQNHPFSAGVGFSFDIITPYTPFTFNVSADGVCCPLS